MTELDGTISFWGTTLEHDKFLMSPSTIYLVEQTIRFLKELKQLKADVDAEKHD